MIPDIQRELLRKIVAYLSAMGSYASAMVAYSKELACSSADSQSETAVNFRDARLAAIQALDDLRPTLFAVYHDEAASSGSVRHAADLAVAAISAYRVWNSDSHSEKYGNIIGSFKPELFQAFTIALQHAQQVIVSEAAGPLPGTVTKAPALPGASMLLRTD